MSFLAGLPQDVVRKCPIITMVGRNQLHVENFKTILEYDENFIKIRTKDGILAVAGTNLKVLYFNCEEIKITGIIAEIRFGA